METLNFKKHIPYWKRPESLITGIYRRQVESSKKRGYALPDYSRDELFWWMVYQPNFVKLYNAWIESNFDKRKTPSIDRLDDYKSYTFDNIQLVTWEENDKKHKQDTKNGINNKRSKAVIGINVKTGEKIEFPSASSAARHFDIAPTNIIVCCNKKTIIVNDRKTERIVHRKISVGHKWFYKKDYEKKDSN